MPLGRQAANWALGFPALLSLLAFPGCGGGTSPTGTGLIPITARLSVSPVVISQDGKPTGVVLTITSTSETARVNIGGLPAGVQYTYQPTDTNPSGLLTFTASKPTPVGSYMPIITVNSANQTVSLQFSLMVKSTRASIPG